MRKWGFVFIELLIVMGLIVSLLSLVTVSLLGSQRKALLTGVVDTLVSDLRSQQTKAMSGTATSGAGVYFQNNQYTMFFGPSYNAVDPTNAVIALEPQIRIGTTLPGGTVVFQAKSGEIADFVAGSDSITVTQIDNSQTKIIQLNRYGTIVAIN